MLDGNDLAWAQEVDPGLRDVPVLSIVREVSEPASVASHLYRFGPFVLDSRKRTLSRSDSPVFLTPKAFDVLIFLVRNPHRLVTKQELLQSVWGDTFVEEGNLAQYISHLRRALGDHADGTRLIVTIARKGYQFTGNVEVVEIADIARHDPLQARETEILTRDATSAAFPARDAASKAPAFSRRVVVALACALFFLGAGYLSLRLRGTQPAASNKVRLAVLPFENLTGDPNREYLADGLTEETISQLGRLNPDQLSVIARTSVMGYKHKDEGLDQIGRELSVQYVLENSLRESGDHLRLTVQLIRVKDQTHLWSQDYDYRVQDVLTLQDDVAKALAREIQLRLSPQPGRESARLQPVDPEAFDALLHGYHFYMRNTNESAGEAAKYFERATQLDPSYALAWVWLSRARYSLADRGLVPTEEGHRLAREAAERALALNPNLAEAHDQMGRIKVLVDLDLVGADASFQHAISLEPGNSDIAPWEPIIAAGLARYEEAHKLARRNVDLDPLNAGSWATRGQLEFYIGDLNEAAADLKKALELNPDDVIGHYFLSQTYVVQARPNDASAEIEKERYEPYRLQQHAIAYHALGRQKESDAALKQLIDKHSTIAAFPIAEVYAFQNQPDEAFMWLDRAYAQHDGGLATANLDPMLRRLHYDPRYAAFLKKIHLPALT